MHHGETATTITVTCWGHYYFILQIHLFNKVIAFHELRGGDSWEQQRRRRLVNDQLQAMAVHS